MTAGPVGDTLPEAIAELPPVCRIHVLARFLAAVLLAALTPIFPAAARPCTETPAGPGRLSVNFLGVSTIVVRAGDEAIMVDGFFSRPSFRQSLFTRLMPNATLIGDGLKHARLGLEGAARPGDARLLALLVAQAHHDHGMDAGVVARDTGAVIVGSRSTANIARGVRLPEERIVTVDREWRDCFGPFRVRAIQSPHSPGIVPAILTGWIRRPLIPPRHALAYRDRRNFSLYAMERRACSFTPAPTIPAGAWET